MRVIICGGRDFELLFSDYEFLNRLHAELPITEVVSGGQSKWIASKRRRVGADYFGEQWAKQKGAFP